jgi:hypothetical protein
MKRIEDLEHLSYKERLLRLGLTTLLERHASGNLFETFKIIKGILNYGDGFFCYSRSGRNPGLEKIFYLLGPQRKVENFLRVVKTNPA